MLPEIANFIIWLCILLSSIQCLGIFGEKRFCRAASVTLFLGLTFCFGALIYSFAISDFSLKVVFENSHTMKPLLYKITGTWGNHEGSLLMLIWVISAYGLIYSLVNPNQRALGVQGFVIFLFLLFLEFSSNPFVAFNITPPNGRGLNPLLQDIGLAFHPPMLYAGYVGFSMIFSLAVAALIDGKMDKVFLRDAKFWCMAAWSTLTLGIGLGSWWAYRELGWGGFWFWDPVENASLMPWLAGTALLHSLIVNEKRQSLQKWTLLLSIITFGLSLIGFFLVRSGVLNSVHSFANDPARGMFIVGILVILMASAFLLYGLRAHKFISKTTHDLVSRETGILLNNLILSVLCVIILLGTIYPLLSEVIFQRSISVGAPYFNKTFVPIAIGLIYLCAFGTALKWKKDKLKDVFKRNKYPIVLSVIFSIVIYIVDKSISESLMILSCGLLLSMLAQQIVTKFNKHDLPMNLAHSGMAILAIAIMFVSLFTDKSELMMKKGDKVEVAGFDITLSDISEGMETNYVYRRGILKVQKDSNLVGELNPEMRVYPVEQQTTNEASIMNRFLISDLYAVIGEKNKDGAYAVRIYFKPFVNLIWLAFLMITAGGAMRLVLRKAH